MKRQTRKSRGRSKSRRNRRSRRQKQRGGGSLPIPRNSVAIMSLDPKDIYGVPVVVSKEVAEEQILNK